MGLATARDLGLARVPYDVQVGWTNEQKRARAAMVNEERRHLSMAELAALRSARDKRIMQLRDEGLSQGAIADRAGISRQRVNQILVAMPPPVEQVAPFSSSSTSCKDLHDVETGETEGEQSVLASAERQSTPQGAPSDAPRKVMSKDGIARRVDIVERMKAG